MQGLEKFVVSAKAATYVGDGTQAAPCRKDAHDLTFEDGPWSYRDSYFGGTDFIGQEVVWSGEKAVWAMNYYGYITEPDQIDAARAGDVIKAALSALYAEGRFLGGFEYATDAFQYRDRVRGDYRQFHGVETISNDAGVVYELHYHGGLIKA